MLRWYKQHHCVLSNLILTHLKWSSIISNLIFLTCLIHYQVFIGHTQVRFLLEFYTLRPLLVLIMAFWEFLFYEIWRHMSVTDKTWSIFSYSFTELELYDLHLSIPPLFEPCLIDNPTLPNFVVWIMLIDPKFVFIVVAYLVLLCSSWKTPLLALTRVEFCYVGALFWFAFSSFTFHNFPRYFYISSSWKLMSYTYPIVLRLGYFSICTHKVFYNCFINFFWKYFHWSEMSYQVKAPNCMFFVS
jgi:hypothetical protein